MAPKIATADRVDRDRSLEFETTGSFGKPRGLYDSIEQEFIFENTLTDSLSVELGAHMLGQNVHGLPDLPDFVGVNFMGASVEFRYVAIHRTANAPMQVTLTAQPESRSTRSMPPPRLGRFFWRARSTKIRRIASAAAPKKCPRLFQC